MNLSGPRIAVILVAIAFGTPSFTQDKLAGRPDFSGTWTLDAFLSDNPEQVVRAIRIDTGQSAEPLLAGDIEPGQAGGIGQGAPGRIASGGRGPDRRGSANRESQNSINSDDLKKLTDLTDAVQFASPTLTISQTESDITLASTRGGRQTLHTNGQREQQLLAGGAVDRVATWEGPTLAVAYEVGNAGILTYTYVLVPTTKQLLIRVNFERHRGQPGPFDIKLVYNRTAS
jgi:hypothetical protein